MKHVLDGLRRDIRGNALTIFAVALVPTAIMIGGGIDASVTYTARNKLQNACDAGALAGRLAMVGTDWSEDAEAAGQRFFDFNFPAGTNGVSDAAFTLEQDETDPAQVDGVATAQVPTSMMYLFGYDTIDVTVTCDAMREMGHNDVMLVLDVTNSMTYEPSWGGGETKINLLRDGVMGLYEALDIGDPNSVTRYGFVPFSQTVNVARSLNNRDILRDQYFVDLDMETCTTSRGVTTCTTTPVGKRLIGARDSYFNNGQNGAANENAIIQGFRTSGDGCIEERPSYGNSYNDGEFTISTSVTIDDINEMAGNGSDSDLQFGRYEPTSMEGAHSPFCVSESLPFATYDTDDDFAAAVTSTTTRLGGGTYSDLGMLWGVRFSSRDGFQAANNPDEWSGVPINLHLIYFTDGLTYTSTRRYSSFGFEQYQHRLTGDGSYYGGEPYSTFTANNEERFANLCTLAKSMGITVWVVALDTTYSEAHENCATSSAHFFESDGSDLKDKFVQIGQGIGNLRLTR